MCSWTFGPSGCAENESQRCQGDHQRQALDLVTLRLCPGHPQPSQHPDHEAGNGIIRPAVGVDGQVAFAVVHAGKRLDDHLAHMFGGHVAQQEEPAGERISGQAAVRETLREQGEGGMFQPVVAADTG